MAYVRCMRAVFSWILAVSLLACPAAHQGSTDAMVVDAGPELEPDAGPPGPMDLSLTVTANDGVLEVLEGSSVDAVRSLELRFPVRLKDFRVRLLDWQDKIVPSDESLTEDGLGWIIRPTAPLKSGRAYVVKVDAELGPEISDESGGTWTDWALSFQLSGELQPEPSTKQPANKKKRKK